MASKTSDDPIITQLGNLKRAMLVDSTEPQNRLPVLFNPRELRVRGGVVSGSLNPAGSSHPVQQFHHSKPITTSLDLYWTALALKSRVSGMVMGTMISSSEALASYDLNNIIGWFTQFSYPLEKGVAPAPLLFIWPNTMTMMFILHDWEVQYQRWFADGTPRVISIQLQVTEVRQRPRYAKHMIFTSGWKRSDEGHTSQGVGSGFNIGQRGRGPKISGGG